VNEAGVCGDSWDASWAKPIDSEIKGSDARPLRWEYRSNPKGCLNEEGAVAYFTKVICTALGCPPPRAEPPGQQGVVTCDGVGTHICFSVFYKPLDLGLEIILRVLHMSFCLQGEHTFNFGVLKVFANALLAHTRYIQKETE
jgi:hypothetical protein